MADALLLPRRFLAPSTAAASSSASSYPPPLWALSPASPRLAWLAAAQPRPRRFAGLKVRAFFLILSWEWLWKGRGFVFPCPLRGGALGFLGGFSSNGLVGGSSSFRKFGMFVVPVGGLL
jgi:hypothetical protein